ncbi:MAG: tRNA-intron lyase [archaeon]
MNVILKNRIGIVSENNLKSQLIQKGFGTLSNKDLALDLFELYYLFETKKVKVIDLKKKQISEKNLKEYINKKIKEFEDKYLVYKSFRDKGYIIKDGAIFGFDFRVYEAQTTKTNEHTHTKYVVDVKRSHKETVNEIIKSERLANSIHTTYILAIVDQENRIIKIKIERMI